jgi:hypothetical protein
LSIFRFDLKSDDDIETQWDEHDAVPAVPAGQPQPPVVTRQVFLYARIKHTVKIGDTEWLHVQWFRQLPDQHPEATDVAGGTECLTLELVEPGQARLPCFLPPSEAEVLVHIVHACVAQIPRQCRPVVVDGCLSAVHDMHNKRYLLNRFGR